MAIKRDKTSVVDEGQWTRNGGREEMQLLVKQEAIFHEVMVWPNVTFVNFRCSWVQMNRLNSRNIKLSSDMKMADFKEIR